MYDKFYGIKLQDHVLLYSCETCTFYKTSKLQQDQVVDFYVGDNGLTHEEVLDIQEDLKLRKISRYDEILRNSGQHIGSICITNMCNLDCNFCYSAVSLQKIKRSLDPEVLFKFANSYGVKDIRPIITGGEPLLVWDALKEICEETKDFLIFTNGLLLDEKKLSYLSKFKFRMQISLDYDIGKSFKGHTNQKVMEILKEISDHTLRPNIHLNSVTFPSRLHIVQKIRPRQPEFLRKFTRGVGFAIDDETLEMCQKRQSTKYFYEVAKKEVDFILSDKLNSCHSIFSTISLNNILERSQLPVQNCATNPCINFLGEIHLCHGVGCNPLNKAYNEPISYVGYYKSVDREKYLSTLNNSKRLFVCRTCEVRWLCDTLCWQEIYFKDRYLCDMFRVFIPFILWLYLYQKGDNYEATIQSFKTYTEPPLIRRVSIEEFYNKPVYFTKDSVDIISGQNVFQFLKSAIKDRTNRLLFLRGNFYRCHE